TDALLSLQLSLMSRRPPPPPLFPYTTLFRSVRRRAVPLLRRPLVRDGGLHPEPDAHHPQVEQGQQPAGHLCPLSLLQGQQAGDRSEEHTSELQSRENLVCRLLLEKKKSTNHE